MKKDQPPFYKDRSLLHSKLLDYNIVRWLKKHGLHTKPNVSEEQALELRQCFELLDEDSSGTIDTNELTKALETMGLPASRTEIKKALKATNPDGSGLFDFSEFIALMAGNHDTSDLPPEQQKARGLLQSLPFDMLSAAYRRKKLMEEVLQDLKDRRKKRSGVDVLSRIHLPKVSSDSTAVKNKRTMHRRPPIKGSSTVWSVGSITCPPSCLPNPDEEEEEDEVSLARRSSMSRARSSSPPKAPRGSRPASRLDRSPYSGLQLPLSRDQRRCAPSSEPGVRRYVDQMERQASHFLWATGKDYATHYDLFRKNFLLPDESVLLGWDDRDITPPESPGPMQRLGHTQPLASPPIAYQAVPSARGPGTAFGQHVRDSVRARLEAVRITHRSDDDSDSDHARRHARPHCHRHHEHQPQSPSLPHDAQRNLPELRQNNHPSPHMPSQPEAWKNPRHTTTTTSTPALRREVTGSGFPGHLHGGHVERDVKGRTPSPINAPRIAMSISTPALHGT